MAEKALQIFFIHGFKDAFEPVYLAVSQSEVPAE
jgi:hypothetical protein